MASLSTDGRRLATAKLNGLYVNIWDVPTGKLLRTIESAGRRYVTTLAISPDGKSLAAGTNDGVYRLFNTGTGKEVRTFGTNHMNGSYSGGSNLLRFSPDGKRLFISGMTFDGVSFRRATKVWDTDSGKTLFELAGKNQFSSMYSAAFSPDGKRLVCGDLSGEVTLADALTGKVLKTFESNLTRLDSLLFSADGKQLLGRSSYDGSVAIWDSTSGKELKSLGKATPAPGVRRAVRLTNPYGVGTGLAITPDGKKLISGEGNLIRVIDIESGKDLHPSAGHRSALLGMSYGSEGKQITTCSGDGTFLTWDAATGKLLRQYLPPLGTYSVRLSPDGKQVVAETTRGELAVIDLATGRQVVKVAPRPRSRLSILALTRDGKYLATRVRSDSVVRLFSLGTGKEVGKFGADPNPARVGSRYLRSAALDFSPDGQLLAVPGVEGGLALHEAPSGSLFRDLPVPKQSVVRTLCFSADGRMLAVELEDSSVMVLEVSSGLERRHFTPGADNKNAVRRAIITSQTNPFQTLAFSSDARRLAVATRDGRTVVYDLLAGEEVGKFAGHAADVQALAFSPDGKRLATGSDDCTGLVWDLTGLKVAKLPSKKLTPAELEKLWTTLGEPDAKAGFDAIGKLANAPAQTVPLLRERMKSKVAIDPAAIEKLIVDLDARRFSVRKHALEELEKLGPLATPALEKALKGKPSEELKKRAKELLAKVTGRFLSTPQMRAVRAIETLERIGTSEAREVLGSVAEGASHARETVEAKAALKRLGK
jgi:WD40 repeat protein